MTERERSRADQAAHDGMAAHTRCETLTPQFPPLTDLGAFGEQATGRDPHPAKKFAAATTPVQMHVQTRRHDAWPGCRST